MIAECLIYRVPAGDFFLRVDADSTKASLQFWPGNPAGPKYFFYNAPLPVSAGNVTPLGVFSTVLAQRPGLLDLEHVRALRDRLLAQPGALRAGS